MRVNLPYPDKAQPVRTAWTEDQLLVLREGYARNDSPNTISVLIGRSPSAVRNKAWELGITNRPRRWTEKEIQEVKDAYAAADLNPVLDLAGLAVKLRRDKASVCRKARELGLTNNARKVVSERKDRRKFKTKEDLAAARSENTRRYLRDKGHPRGMSGKSHSSETKERLSETSKQHQRKLTKRQKSEIAYKAVRTTSERYGSAAPRHSRGSWKAGWREIGSKRIYFRSRWEANYARYLQWLKERGEIADWQHEPETFWFESIKRGVRSYLPDFRVWEVDNSTSLHEVKGWMDARSKTTLKRMAKYHPHETILVVREKQYNEIARKIGCLIEGWESSEKAGRL